MEPHRVVLSRKKGWRIPPNTVSVSRPSKWGNPVSIGPIYSVFEAVAYFREYVDLKKKNDPKGFQEWIAPLRGKNLACWCKASPCHADVLLEEANQENS